MSPALAALGWPTVREMIAQHDAVNVYRAIHIAASPENLQAMFLQRSAVSERLMRATVAGAAALELPGLRLTTSRRLFPYRAAAAWNALSRDVTASASRLKHLNHFKRR